MARIVLKSDFDGVVGAMLLRSVVPVDDIVFTHPEDIWSGVFTFNDTDYVLNLPVIQPVAAHFTGHCYPGETPSNEIDGRQLCVQQILAAYAQLESNPEAIRWANAVMDLHEGSLLLDEFAELDFHLQMAILVDPLTGMGRRKDFLKSNYYFLLDLIENGLKRSGSDWLEELDLQDRIHYYINEQPKYQAFLTDHAYVRGPAVIVDKRMKEQMPLGNRLNVFKVYDAPYVLYLYLGKEKGSVVLTGVTSPFKRRSHDLGRVFSSLGGYGDDAYGTLQLNEDNFEESLEKLLAMLL